MKYTAKQLRAMPTRSVGQADDLKVETSTMRVWISRCTVEDGEPFDDKVTVERLRNGRWEVADEYQG